MRGTPGAFGSYHQDQTRSSGSRPEAPGLKSCNLTQRPLLMAAASFPTAAARYLQTRQVYSLPGQLSVTMRLSTTLSSCRAGAAAAGPSSAGPSWAPFSGGNLTNFGASGGFNQNTIRGFLTGAASSLNTRLQAPLGGAPFQTRCALILPGSLQPLRSLSERGDTPPEAVAEDTADGSPPPAKGSPNPDLNGDAPAEKPSKQLLLRTGVEMLPHPEKAHRGGEDAYFVCKSGLSLGVADGVGGWAEVGIDAGMYSRTLMGHSLEAVEKEEVMTAATPLKVLKHAHQHTKIQGSCTACIITMGQGTVHAANLGDSGFIIIRSGRIVFKSPQQQHDFNFPFQLSSGEGMSDPPEAASTFSVPVVENDIIVTGTDGLFDNIFTDEIARVAVLTRKNGDSPARAASHLASLAQLRAADTEVMSPFGMAAQQVGFMYRGGKMDDITVVVSYVTKAEDLKLPEASTSTPAPPKSSRL